MKIKSILLIFIFFSICALQTLNAQKKSQLRRADNFFENKEYSFAIDYYKLYLEGTHDLNAIAKLAECYRKTNENREAERLYDVLVRSIEVQPIHYYNYADVLRKLEKYSDAKKWYIEYMSAVPEDKYVRDLIKSCELYSEFISDTMIYKIYNLNINTPQSDFGAAFYKEGIVFSSARNVDNLSESKYGWTNENFLDLYYSKTGFKDKFREPVNFSKVINSKYHEGPVCFQNNEDFIYFTRSNFLNDKRLSSSNGVNNVNIYTSKRVDDTWSEPVLFEVHSIDASIGHPTITEDGKYMYFAANLPGGFGGTDIYMCQKLGYVWTKPVNLGSEINTSSDELFPFIHKDGSLYFSSAGHEGLGGLDIFVSRYNGYRWEDVINMRTPFNSSSDDFAFIIEEKNERGFFSSNRIGGKGGDDIYHFIKNVDAFNALNGKVISMKTKQPIEGVNITLKDFVTTDKEKITTNEGKFGFMIEPNVDYKMIVNKAGFKTKTVVHYADEHKNEQESYYEIELETSIWLNLEGRVFEFQTKDPIADVDVKLNNKTYGLTSETITTERGEFEFDLDPDCQYEIVLSKPGYFTEQEPLSTLGKVESETFRYDLYLGMRPIAVNKTIELENIFYALDRWDLNQQSKEECDKLVNILMANPAITIELRSHTDSRGGDSYNMELSQKRAQSVVDYVASKGVARNRMIPKGYGETQLKNHCSNGVICPDKLHKQNRRTEFVILTN